MTLNYIIIFVCIGWTLCYGCCYGLYYVKKRRQKKKREKLLLQLVNDLSINTTRLPSPPDPPPPSPVDYYKEFTKPSPELKQKYINELIYEYITRIDDSLTEDEVLLKYNYLKKPKDIKDLKNALVLV